MMFLLSLFLFSDTSLQYEYKYDLFTFSCHFPLKEAGELCKTTII